MAKKKTIKKTSPEVDQNYLTEEEILTIALAEREVELVRKDEMAIDAKKNLVALQYKNSMLELDLSAQLIKNKLDGKIKSQNNKLKSMATKRSIEGKWSYNPETREVVRED